MNVLPAPAIALLSRFGKLWMWCRGHRNGLSVSDILAHLSSPSSGALAKTIIRQVDSLDHVSRVWLHGYSTPIFYPDTFGMSELYSNIAEQFAPGHWHSYAPIAYPQMRLRPNDVIVDAGAYVGLFSVMVHEYCRMLHVFEPNSSAVACLHRSFDGVSNVVVHSSALADKAGEARMAEDDGPGSRFSDSPGDLIVPVQTLDEMFSEEPVTFIKADVEGAALNMLHGASRLLRNVQPRLALACYHYESEFGDLSEYISGLSSSYTIKGRGISRFGGPVMLYAWSGSH